MKYRSTIITIGEQDSSIYASPLLVAVVAVAKREIGVCEDPPGSNSGQKVSSYLKSVCTGAGNPWCAAFVYWCFEQASAELNLDNPLVKTASCMNHWLKTSGEKITSKQAVNDPLLIEPGTIFIIRRGNIKGHTGIVTDIRDGYLRTIEGNTNAFHAAEGGGVLALQRRFSEINMGFIKYC